MMKLKCMLVIAAILFLAVQAAGAEPSVLKTRKDKMSYAIGADMAKKIRQQGLDLDADVLARAVKDVFEERDLLMNEKEIHKTMASVQFDLRQMRAQAQTTRTRDTEANRKEGEAFLADNKTKEGVLTLPSGLQYRVLKAAEGRKPAEADLVEVNYRGTLINGTEFDNTSRRGEPTISPVSGFIPGVKEALTLMPVGSRWQLFIPPSLAYGTRGSGSKIGPNATLIFEMELVAIK